MATLMPRNPKGLLLRRRTTPCGRAQLRPPPGLFLMRPQVPAPQTGTCFEADTENRTLEMRVSIDYSDRNFR
jgi:hypothetical protein